VNRTPRHRRWTTAAGVLAAVAVAVTGTGSALALTLFPTRVVLNDQDRAAQLQIINNSDRPQRYIIEWQTMAMSPSGRLQFAERSEVPTPQASDHVISGPRQAIVPPNGYQVVRLLSRIPPDAPSGEYRSHLVVSEPPMQTDNAPSSSNGTGIEIEINTVVKTTIPVILRKGDTSVSVEPEAWWFRGDTSDGPQLGLSVQRQGNQSVNARATITWIEEDKNERQLIQRRFAVYTDINQRAVIHRLPGLNGANLSKGRIAYVLERLNDDGQPVETLFTRTLDLTALPRSRASSH
jgi:P pilus assembly chaperone PapD